MTAYSKGSRKENELLRYLEYHGFTGCRSSGSHGHWDLIASPSRVTPRRETLHIQCGTKTKHDVSELRHVAINHYGIFVHALFMDRKTPIVRRLDSNDTEQYYINDFITYIYGIKTENYFDVIKRLNPIKEKSRKA